MSDIPFSVRGKTTFLNKLNDVNIQNPLNSQVLEYNSLQEKWINGLGGAAQTVLDPPLVASPSLTGNLALSSGTGFNNLLTYTPPDLNNITGDTTVVGNATMNNLKALSDKLYSSTMAGVKGDFNNLTVPVSGSSLTAIQDVNCTSLTSTGALNSSTASVGANATSGTFSSTGLCTCATMIVGGQSFADTINYWGQPIWFRTSDSKLKWNQQPIKNGLETIMKLKPMTYDMANKILDKKPDDSNKSAGIIAQDLLAIPELKYFVDRDLYDDDEKKPLKVDYGAIFSHSISAIKELNENMSLTDRKLFALENKVNKALLIVG